jgi:hypothetical protein
MGLDTSCNNIKDVVSLPTVWERRSLMLLQLVSSPICYVIFVIFTLTSDSRLMRRDCRRGKDLFIVVATCVQSHITSITLQMGLDIS